MSVRERRQVASDAGLSKQRVVVEAIRLADREGVDGLSMRRLADALGAGAMSLYYYVANKEELLDAMIDVVFEEIELPPDRHRLAVGDVAAVDVRPASPRTPPVGDRPDGVADAPGPANLRHHEAVFACLGRPASRLRWRRMPTGCSTAMSTVSRCRKPAFPSTPPRSSRTWARMATCPSFRDQFPYLNESAATLLAAGYDPADEFTFGLDLVLAALEALTASP